MPGVGGRESCRRLEVWVISRARGSRVEARLCESVGTRYRRGVCLCLCSRRLPLPRSAPVSLCLCSGENTDCCLLLPLWLCVRCSTMGDKWCPLSLEEVKSLTVPKLKAELARLDQPTGGLKRKAQYVDALTVSAFWVEKCRARKDRL